MASATPYRSGGGAISSNVGVVQTPGSSAMQSAGVSQGMSPSYLHRHMHQHQHFVDAADGQQTAPALVRATLDAAAHGDRSFDASTEAAVEAAVSQSMGGHHALHAPLLGAPPASNHASQNKAGVDASVFLSSRSSHSAHHSHSTSTSAKGGALARTSDAQHSAVNKLSAELETVRSNWRTEGSLTRGKMIELHHAKLRAEEALYEARSSAKAAALKAQQREDALRAEVSSLRDSLDAVTRERSRQEQDWLSQAGAFRREVEKLREQASELDSEIQTVEAGRQAALTRAEASEESVRSCENTIQTLRQDIARLEVENSDAKHTFEKQIAGLRSDEELASATHREEVERLNTVISETKRKVTNITAELNHTRQDGNKTEEHLREALTDAQVRAARDLSSADERLQRIESERDLALAQVSQLKQLLATAEGEFSAVATAVDLLSRGQTLDDGEYHQGGYGGYGGGYGEATPGGRTTVVNVNTPSAGVTRRLSPSM